VRDKTKLQRQQISGSARTAKDIIDQAISENRRSEWLLYSFALLFVVGGLGTLVWGALQGEEITAIAGLVATSFFYPAMRWAYRIRKENFAIRMLEATLSNALSEKQAVAMLTELVDRILRGNLEKR